MTSRAATDVFAELKSIKALLGGAGPAGTNAAATPLPPSAAAAAISTSDEEDFGPPPPQRAVRAGATQDAAKMRELERQVAALRQQQAEGEDRARRLQDALAAAQHDGALLAQRYQAQLQAKQEEVRGGTLKGVRLMCRACACILGQACLSTS